MKQNTVILDTGVLLEKIQAIYPSLQIHVLVKLLSRLMIVFLSTPVNQIDRELNYSGFYPNGYDPKVKEAIVDLFKNIIERVKYLWPKANIEYIRHNACFGYQNIQNTNRWILILFDKQNTPSDPNFIIF